MYSIIEHVRKIQESGAVRSALTYILGSVAVLLPLTGCIDTSLPEEEVEDFTVVMDSIHRNPEPLVDSVYLDRLSKTNYTFQYITDDGGRNFIEKSTFVKFINRHIERGYFMSHDSVEQTKWTHMLPEHRVSHNTREGVNILTYETVYNPPSPVRKYVSILENKFWVRDGEVLAIQLDDRIFTNKAVKINYPDPKKEVPAKSSPTVEEDEVEISYLEHKVRRGQTLSGIALYYNVSVRDIRRANNMSSYNSTIRINQILKIPQKNGMENKK